MEFAEAQSRVQLKGLPAGLAQKCPCPRLPGRRGHWYPESFPLFRIDLTKFSLNQLIDPGGLLFEMPKFSNLPENERIILARS